VDDAIGSHEQKASGAVAPLEHAIGIGEVATFRKDGIARAEEGRDECGPASGAAGEHDPGHARTEQIVEAHAASVRCKNRRLRQVPSRMPRLREESLVEHRTNPRSAEHPTPGEQRGRADPAKRGRHDATFDRRRR
jgi:hypothetical protein